MLDTNSNSFLEDQKAWLIKHSSAFGVLERKKFQTQKRVKFLFLFFGSELFEGGRNSFKTK